MASAARGTVERHLQACLSELTLAEAHEGAPLAASVAALADGDLARLGLELEGLALDVRAVA